MNIWIDTGGLYLRPLAIFRLFHPLLHIRWDAIASIEPRKTLWVKAHQFTFRRDVPMMTFGQPAGQAIFDRWQAHHGDRKSVVEGKRVSVRVDPGGGRSLKKKKQ